MYMKIINNPCKNTWTEEKDEDQEVVTTRGKDQSSTDAELLALNAVLASCFSTDHDNICILTDSKSALQVLAKPETTAYSIRINEIREAISDLYDCGKNLTLQWVPSHCGIIGNERADEIAKHASNTTRRFLPAALSRRR